MDAIWPALLTGSFTLLGVAVTLSYGNKRSLVEHERWFVDHFLKDKLERLRDLHVSLVDCHFTLNIYGLTPPRTLVEYKEKIGPKEQDYLRAMVIASLYLTEEEKSVFASALSAFRPAGMAIWLNLPDGEINADRRSYSEEHRQVNWQDFTRTYENAVKLLTEIES